MKIDGRAIAEKMLADLAGQVAKLKEQGVAPTLAVILVGDNPASISYIKQKTKAAETIGAKLILSHQPSTISDQQLKTLIEQYNNDSSVHGIIVQRPLPSTLSDAGTSLIGVLPRKDVDGFVPGSPFEVPVASAVFEILKNCKSQISNPNDQQKSFDNWIQTKSFVVIGRGETAGKPIAELLVKKGCNVTVMHSQTKNPDEKIKAADIVISCVGKQNVVRRENIKKNSILISVGIWRDSEGKLHGDYDEDAIADVASFYTPTPGGVGPVNVACLMKNLVLAARNKSSIFPGKPKNLIDRPNFVT
ncbi:bifunctional 5,10-methylenetetrahydrofolate dehydrogenase/5,10-methenyltetrahydrofolate cyclohydrolase [Candidatus Gottesmanbacteria bacterium]|nr:bifunctional 5,10-methylenetetrahydrofolate dehydrogenase/5,10-methenyltetrahydrofolate cyclohydrolase [Candidatus Gottesmanbacteria bacterium]